MKNTHPFKILIYLLAVAALPAMAQKDLSAEVWFDKQVGLENSGLFNGHEYLFPFRGASTHPFFFAEGGSKGEVFYNHQWYPEIFLMYDLFTNEVILKHQTNGLTKLMCFDQNDLDSFTLFDHHFLKINGQFYDVLFKGTDWALLATRKKSRQVISGSVEFEEELNYFIQQAQGLTLFSGKKTFMSLCPQHVDLQDFINKNKIRLGQKNEKDLVLICQFIEKSRKSAK